MTRLSWKGRMPRTSALIVAAAAVLLPPPGSLVLAGPGDESALTPNTIVCIDGLANMVSDLTSAVYDVLQATTDCSTESRDDTACASDITAFFEALGSTLTDLTVVTMACGAIKSYCALTTTDTVQELSGACHSVIAASADCIRDAMFCAFDVVEAIDHFNGVAKDIYLSVDVCRKLYLTQGPIMLDGSAVPPFAGGRLNETVPLAFGDALLEHGHGAKSKDARAPGLSNTKRASHPPAFLLRQGSFLDGAAAAEPATVLV